MSNKSPAGICGCVDVFSTDSRVTLTKATVMADCGSYKAGLVATLLVVTDDWMVYCFKEPETIIRVTSERDRASPIWFVFGLKSL